MTNTSRWAIIGINEYGYRHRIAVEESINSAIEFINSQRVEQTFVTYNEYKSNFKHTHILRGYVDAIVEPFDE